ncbi:MAG: circadian clock protein KaiC [Myxococcota bacterium]
MQHAPAETASAPKRLPTGIAGLDAIMDGGLPRGGITVVIGGAGTGKTTFGLQVLASGARGGEPGMLVAFEESAARVVENSSGFDWGGDALRTAAVQVIDAQLTQAIELGGEFDLVGFLAILGAAAKQSGARRVVFDGLDVLLGYLGDPALMRREVFRLRDWVHQSGLTAIVTAKGDDGLHRPAAEYDFLQFMADCVVTMHHRVVHGMALRFIRVAKYRGAAHSANELPIALTSSGVEVAANTTVALGHPASGERMSTGVERLDAMLSGGYYRGSSVLITGVPGTAKTSLAAVFAEAAARRGERTVFVSFDEAPDQIVRNVASIGIDFAGPIAAGVLSVHGFRSRFESPEAQVARVRALVRETRPQNLVVDPLSSLSQRGREADGEGAALELLDFAKSAGITLIGTSLLGNSLPLTEHTPLNISTVADTWMHVSYVNQGGERNRALTIIKARGIGHSNQVRELILSDAGVTLADVYAVGGEVLMGTLRWEKENEARRARTVAQNGSALRQRKAEAALAATRTQLEALAREEAIQQAELEQLKLATSAESDHRAGEEDERLQRRRADPEAPSVADASAPDGGS